MVGLRDISFVPLNVPLYEPFGIATGAQAVAENVLVRLELDDTTVGLGEAAPVAHISGESQAAVLAAAGDMQSALRGVDLLDYRRVSALTAEVFAAVPSALAAVEMALLDALTRRFGLSLRSFFGGAEASLEIDVTITTGTVEHAAAAALRHRKAGFRLFKVKIGGGDWENDVQRLLSIVRACPDARLILDGNTALSPAGAVEILGALGEQRERVILFEQPVERDDFEGLREVEQKGQVPVAADESLRSRADFQRILKVGGISAINIKTAKLGVLGAWDLLIAGRAAGLDVMVGGMVETEISMTTSACLAAGVGGVRFADLDTPLFLAERPAIGRIQPWGPTLDLSAIHLGHGVELAEPERIRGETSRGQ